MSLISRVRDFACNPSHTQWLFPMLVAADALLCAFIITNVPYTEIDWSTYMQQISIYLKGERDYNEISGSTGPLVYPGAHVWIYKQLYVWTDQGTNIKMAQRIFALVYLVSLGIVGACYRRANVSPNVFPMLVLSKRLHSIFMLRCFNDCFAALALWSTIFCYQRNRWLLGTLFYGMGLNVKMSLLLPLPAIGVLMLQKLGSREALKQVVIIIQISIIYGLPFRKCVTSYLSKAFEFSRVFQYKWTVNWRFVQESTFLSKSFSLSLLAVHVGLLLWFFKTRWMKLSKGDFREYFKLIFSTQATSRQSNMAGGITPDFVMSTILTATMIGMLCARSLHYQFFAYIAWATPFLLWKSGLHPVIQYVLWGTQEWAWNVYPSTPLSSATVVCLLAVSVAGSWWGTRNEYRKMMNGAIEGISERNK